MFMKMFSDKEFIVSNLTFFRSSRIAKGVSFRAVFGPFKTYRPIIATFDFFRTNWSNDSIAALAY